jgi:hypothetical protein
MFYLKRKYVYCSQPKMGKIQEIPQLLNELDSLYQNWVIEQNLERYTEEGIDLEFKAESNYILTEEMWLEDAQNSWSNYTGPELFNRYQKHAEVFIEICINNDIDVTYEGFRQWLINIFKMEKGEIYE